MTRGIERRRVREGAGARVKRSGGGGGDVGRPGGGFSPGAGGGRVGGAVGCDPLDDARALLALTRLLYRARVAAARHGVLPARARARALVPLGGGWPRRWAPRRRPPRGARRGRRRWSDDEQEVPDVHRRMHVDVAVQVDTHDIVAVLPEHPLQADSSVVLPVPRNPATSSRSRPR